MPLMSVDEFVNHFVGKYWNFDGAYGNQCADLWNFYVRDVAGGSDFYSYMSAKEIGEKGLTFGGAFDIIPADKLGKKGDGVIFGAVGPFNGGGYGHVGILTRDERPASQIQMINQSPPPVQYPARIENCSTNGVIAYLRPKVLHKKAAEQPRTASNQRIVGAAGARYRKEPKVAEGNVIQTFAPDTLTTWKGYVKGQHVNGSNIWFVGAYTGKYSHCSGFTNQKTTGLPDLTPKPVAAPKPAKLAPDQRKVGAAGARQRTEPSTATGKIVMTLEPDFVFTAKGYVHGKQKIAGSDVWIVGKNSGQYVHVSGLTDKTTTGLKNLTPPAAPVVKAPVAPKAPQKPAPAPQKPTPPAVVPMVGAELPCVTKALAASPENYGQGNFPAKPTKVVIHQFGTKGVDTEAGTLGWFATPRPDNPTSAHFVVSGKSITQMVSLKNRAYHAGTVGNDYVGIETDPHQDPETVASVQKLLRELNDHFGYELEPVLHRNVPGNATNCGADITLDNYRNLGFTVKPVKPVEAVNQEQLKAEIVKSLQTLTTLVNKLDLS